MAFRCFGSRQMSCAILLNPRELGEQRTLLRHHLDRSIWLSIDSTTTLTLVVSEMVNTEKSDAINDAGSRRSDIHELHEHTDQGGLAAAALAGAAVSNVAKLYLCRSLMLVDHEVGILCMLHSSAPIL